MWGRPYHCASIFSLLNFSLLRISVLLCAFFFHKRDIFRSRSCVFETTEEFGRTFQRNLSPICVLFTLASRPPTARAFSGVFRSLYSREKLFFSNKCGHFRKHYAHLTLLRESSLGLADFESDLRRPCGGAV